MSRDGYYGGGGYSGGYGGGYGDAYRSNSSYGHGRAVPADAADRKSREIQEYVRKRQEQKEHADALRRERRKPEAGAPGPAAAPPPASGVASPPPSRHRPYAQDGYNDGYASASSSRSSASGASSRLGRAASSASSYAYDSGPGFPPPPAQSSTGPYARDRDRDVYSGRDYPAHTAMPAPSNGPYDEGPRDREREHRYGAPLSATSAPHGASAARVASAGRRAGLSTQQYAHGPPMSGGRSGYGREAPPAHERSRDVYGREPHDGRDFRDRHTHDRDERDVLHERAVRAPSASGSSRGGALASDPDLLRRIASLEEEVRFLRHQNKLFLNFMQTTEGQLLALKPLSQTLGQGGLSSALAVLEKVGVPAPPSVSTGTPAATGPHQHAQARYSTHPLSASSSSGPVSSSTGAPGEPHRQRDRADRDSHARGGRMSDDRHDISGTAPGRPPPQPSGSSRGFEPPREEAPRAAAPRPPSAASHVHNQELGPRDGGFDGGFEGDDGDEATGGLPDDAYAPAQDLFPCDHCGRRFNADALRRHRKSRVCQKKERKKFDISKQRMPAEARALARREGKSSAAAPSGGGAATIAGAEKQPKWRRERARLQEAIRAGKEIKKAFAEGKSGRDLPPPPTSAVEDDRVPCPYCGRKFNENVAERHIPHCKNTKHRPTGPPVSRRR